MIIVLMGVSGSGKTTIGLELSSDLGWPFYDGDNFHPPANIEKMKRGVPLADEDRRSWLEELRELTHRLTHENKSAIVACSALKKSYREHLRAGSSQVLFVHLKGDYELIRRRMEKRGGHFMKPELLKSQFETLEESDDAVAVDIEKEPATIVGIIKRKLNLLEMGGPFLKIGSLPYPPPKT